MQEMTISYFPFALKAFIFLFTLAYLPAAFKAATRTMSVALFKNKWLLLASTPFVGYANFVQGRNKNWYTCFARTLLATLFIIIPITYDPVVPEAAGDLRWYFMHGVTLTLLTAFVIFKLLEKSKQKTFTLDLKFTPTGWATIIAVLFGFLTLTWGMNFSNNWWFLKHLVAYALIFAFAVQLRDRNWYENLLWVLVLGGAFNGALGLLQYQSITDTMIANYIPFVDNVHITNFFRQAAPPAGTLSNKNLAASFMIICLPVALYLMLTARTKTKLVISSICFTLCGSMLLCTKSRGSWVSAIAAIIFAIIWLILNKKDRQSIIHKFNIVRSTALLSSLLAISVIGTMDAGDTMIKRVHTSVSDQFKSIKNISAGELETRLVYNINGVDILMDNPMGVGLGSFHNIYPKYFNSSALTPKVGYNISARPRRMHNDMFQSIIELGIIGGLAHLYIFVSPLFMAWRLARSETVPENHKVLSFALITSIAGICVNSLGDFPLQMPTAPAYLWLSVGMITGLYVMHIKGANIGWTITTSIPQKAALSILSLVLIASTIAITYDNYQRREATKYLKNAVALSRGNINNDFALYFVEKAQKFYPHIARLQEIRAVIFTNHDNKKPQSKAKIEDTTRLAIVERVLKTDPYAQNNLVNASMINIRMAHRLTREKKFKEATAAALKSIEYANKAVEVSYYAPNAHTIRAVAYILLNKLPEAKADLEEALRRDPNFNAAQSYLKKVNGALAKRKQNKN